MRTKTAKWTTIATLLVAMAGPVRAAAQGDQLRLAAEEQKDGHKHNKQHARYVLKDLGTFGGPSSELQSVPIIKSLNNRGSAVGVADTLDPNPYYPHDNPIVNDPLVVHAFRWRDGVLTDLGTLPGGVNSLGGWINDQGVVAGTSEDGLVDPLLGVPELVAVLWKHGEIVRLGTLDGGYEATANAVNNRGQAVGAALNTIPDEFSFQLDIGVGSTQTRAFLWENGVMRDLGTLGGPDAFARYVNEAGQIAGDSYTNSTPNSTTGIPTQDPFLWERGKMSDLGTLGGTIGVAFGLNERGEVVGLSYLSGDQIFHPFLWSRGVLRDLGSLGGDNGAAFWINDAGEVVGRTEIRGSKERHAFFWKHGVMTDLGTVDGDACSAALGINARSQVIGDSGPCGSTRVGFLWENGSMVDLNDLVVSGPDLRVTQIGFINDRGEISGQGMLPNGDQHAVLLIPCDREHAEADGCENETVRTITTIENTAGSARPVTAGAALGTSTKVSAADRIRDRLTNWRRLPAQP